MPAVHRKNIKLSYPASTDVTRQRYLSLGVRSPRLGYPPSTTTTTTTTPSVSPTKQLFTSFGLELGSGLTKGSRLGLGLGLSPRLRYPTTVRASPTPTAAIETPRLGYPAATPITATATSSSDASTPTAASAILGVNEAAIDAAFFEFVATVKAIYARNAVPTTTTTTTTTVPVSVANDSCSPQSYILEYPATTTAPDFVVQDSCSPQSYRLNYVTTTATVADSDVHNSCSPQIHRLGFPTATPEAYPDEDGDLYIDYELYDDQSRITPLNGMKLFPPLF